MISSTERPELKSPADIISHAFDSTLKKLKGHNKTVLFIHAIPELDFDPSECLPLRPFSFFKSRKEQDCSLPLALYEQRASEYKKVIKEVLSNHPEVHELETEQLFCSGEKCLFKNLQEEILYRDDIHLSNAGNKLLLDLIVSSSQKMK